MDVVSMITEGYQVELCGTEWFVTEVSGERLVNIQESKGETCELPDDGRCEFDNQTIMIRDDLHSHRKALALTHEMLHVVCDSVGIEDDEELILKLEHGVYQMINAFPDEYKKRSIETRKLFGGQQQK